MTRPLGQIPRHHISKCLTKKGQLLTNYYAIGHFSLDNYIAMISGQSPNPDTQLTVRYSTISL